MSEKKREGERDSLPLILGVLALLLLATGLTNLLLEQWIGTIYVIGSGAVIGLTIVANHTGAISLPLQRFRFSIRAMLAVTALVCSRLTE